MPSRNRGKPKPKLRDLSRMSLTSDETEALTDAIMGANPIVTAITGAVLVEHELETSLRSRLRKRDDDTWAEMTSDDGPFGTLHKKITAGFALGVYDDIVAYNLNIVRTIRNAFAHSKKLIDFDHQLIIGELAKIKFHRNRDRKKFETEEEKMTYQHRYRTLCFMLCCEFMAKNNSALRLQSNRFTKKIAKLKSTLFVDAKAINRLLEQAHATIALFGPRALLDHQNGGPIPGALKGSHYVPPAKRSGDNNT